MILVDANLLLYAQNIASNEHAKAKSWWDQQLSGKEPVCLCWPVLTAFIRIGTNPRVFARPLGLVQASDIVQSWLDQPNTRLIHPTETHWETLRAMLEASQAIGNLVTDAHLAALAIEHGCRLASTDSDFSRFPRLKWFNPIRDEPKS